MINRRRSPSVGSARRRRPSRFTLIELLAVTATAGILAGLLLSALRQDRGVGQAAECNNNLCQLHTAWGIYCDDAGDRAPPNGVARVDSIWRSDLDSSVGPSNAPFNADHEPITQGLVFRFGYHKEPRGYRRPADRAAAHDFNGGTPITRRSRIHSMNDASAAFHFLARTTRSGQSSLNAPQVTD